MVAEAVSASGPGFLCSLALSLPKPSSPREPSVQPCSWPRAGALLLWGWGGRGSCDAQQPLMGVTVISGTQTPPALGGAAVSFPRQHEALSGKVFLPGEDAFVRRML